MSGGLGLDTDSKTAWISQGFERLIDRVRKAPTEIHFDVLIIGSGYGGAIAAATFAGRQYGGAAVTVGVLERGKEYLPGSFPTGLGELPGHIRQNNNKEGLFDIRLGGEVTTVSRKRGRRWLADQRGRYGSARAERVSDRLAKLVSETCRPGIVFRSRHAILLGAQHQRRFATQSTIILTAYRRNFNHSALSRLPANFARPQSRSQ